MDRRKEGLCTGGGKGLLLLRNASPMEGLASTSPCPGGAVDLLFPETVLVLPLEGPVLTDGYFVPWGAS